MLSFDLVDVVDMLESRDSSLPCRLMKREDLRLDARTVGLGASGLSSSMALIELLPAPRKQEITIVSGCW